MQISLVVGPRCATMPYAMCGRMTLTIDNYDELARLLEAEGDPVARAGFRPRYNIAPTQPHLMVLRAEKRRLVEASWGIRAVAKTVINARVESAASSPLFRDAWRERRCIVPADGFFEWTRRRQPIWYHPAHGRLLRLAGLFERRAGGGLVFTVLTTPANALIAQVHDRMPALLDEAQAEAWLATDEMTLAPAPEDALAARIVTRRVNQVANDDPACLHEEKDRGPLTLL